MLTKELKSQKVSSGPSGAPGSSAPLWPGVSEQARHATLLVLAGCGPVSVLTSQTASGGKCCALAY